MIVKKYKIKFIGNIEGGGLGVSNIFKDVDVIPLEGGIVDHREDLNKGIPWFDYVSPKVHRAKVDGKVIINAYVGVKSLPVFYYPPAVTVSYSKSAHPLNDIENWAWITAFGYTIASVYGTRAIMLSVAIKKGYYYYIAPRKGVPNLGFKCVFLPDRYRFPQIGTEYLKGSFTKDQIIGNANKSGSYISSDFTIQQKFYNNSYANSDEIKGSKPFYKPSDNDGPANNNDPSTSSINHILDKVRVETNESIISHMNTEILKVIDKK